MELFEALAPGHRGRPRHRRRGGGHADLPRTLRRHGAAAAAAAAQQQVQLRVRVRGVRTRLPLRRSVFGDVQNICGDPRVRVEEADDE